ncbi:PDR/VanB family oxidoreductase [Paraburkholderia sediminicola]|uniref:PDR/VanB family oxidoreductase n=1 Tax=Paraburkholderia sediminicola TaxID=458836 RepID=UPI0038BC33EF
MKVCITRKEQVATDIVSFELTAALSTTLPPFSAGSHIDVHIGDSVVRQYSLYNSPADSHRYCIAVLRKLDSRGGSIAMHALETGTELEISEPRNHFLLDPSAAHTILLAGGIGITPILCMVEQLEQIGASYELHYCVRDAERAAFKGRFAKPDVAARVQFYYDNTPEKGRMNFAAVLGEAATGKHVYVCGPGGFIDAALNAARKNGWSESNLHREYFTAAEALTDETNAGFKVKIASSGRVVNIKPEQTILAALTEAGIDIPASCEQGVCGTCLTRVLDGDPDHRDVYMTDEEHAAGDQFTPCCSRSKSALLVLDL